MSDIQIYGPPQSNYVWTARMTAEEKGITHELVGVEFGSESHRALHPFAKVPSMKHGDFTLHETSAIARYIDRAFDGPALQPADPKSAARMDQWISSLNDYYYDDIIRKVVINRILKPLLGGEPDEAEIAAALPRIESKLAILGAHLAETPYLAGADPSLADFFLAPMLASLERTAEGRTLLAGAPKVAEWRQRIQARPSFAATQPPAAK